MCDINGCASNDELQAFSYNAEHAFADLTSARYDAEGTATAWKRTLAFFTNNLA